jgi:hypothetical protein
MGALLAADFQEFVQPAVPFAVKDDFLSQSIASSGKSGRPIT